MRLGYHPVMEATTSVQPPTGGRRERKKQRTRDALIDAAFELFQRQGFEATTVEEIADAVDVSSRTFFRYFASKEEVVLTFQEEQVRAILQTLADRPPEEPVLTALRRAAVSIAQACECGELGFDPSRFQCMMSLMNDSPQVLAGSLEHQQKKQAEMVRAVAERMGVDPREDLRPHVVASAAGCAFRAATDALQDCELTKFHSLSEVVDRAFEILEEGINYPSALA